MKVCRLFAVIIAMFGFLLGSVAEVRATLVAHQQPAPRASSTPAASTPSTAGSSTVLVPGGTTVAIALSEPVSSATARIDDQVAIVVKEEVDVDGWVVIAAGANGHATVTAAQGAGSNGSGGKLAMSVDWVYSADGGKVLQHSRFPPDS
jgi:hypothetical protein